MAHRTSTKPAKICGATTMSALATTTELGTESYNSTVGEAEQGEEYLGPMVDLGALKEALRRRRKLWVGAALLGLLIGMAFHHIVPAKYAAVTDLYMAEPSGSDPSQAIANDVSLLGTRAVAQPAARAFHLDPETFLTTYQGTALSNVILSIRLSAPSPAKAVSYDNTVAKVFLAVRSQELASETGLVVDGLAAQVKALNSEVKNLTSALNSLADANADAQTANQIESLVDERTTDASQISQLESQEQQDLLSEQAVAGGSQVLDPAAAIKVSVNKVTAEDGLTGLVGGLGLGVGIVLIGAAISDRPRKRSAVAAALDVPVELSVGRYRPPRRLRKMRLRRRLRKPEPVVQMIASRLRGHLEAVPNRALAIVAIGPTQPAALAVAVLARSLASEGQPVLVVDMADDRPLPGLFGMKAGPGSPCTDTTGTGAITIVSAPDDPGQMPKMPAPGDGSVLILVSVSPATGAEHLAGWAEAAVVFVTAGQVTASRMTASTLLLRRAGVTVRSAVLIGSDRYDDSAGVVSSEGPERGVLKSWRSEGKGWGLRASKVPSASSNGKVAGTIEGRADGVPEAIKS